MNCLAFRRHYLSLAGGIYIGTYGMSNVSLMAPHGEGFWNSISDALHRRRYRTRNGVWGLLPPFIFLAAAWRSVLIMALRPGAATPAQPRKSLAILPSDLKRDAQLPRSDICSASTRMALIPPKHLLAPCINSPAGKMAHFEGKR